MVVVEVDAEDAEGWEETDVRSFSISYHDGTFIDTSCTSASSSTVSGDVGSSTDPGNTTVAAALVGICVTLGPDNCEGSAHSGGGCDATGVSGKRTVG